MFRLSGFVVWTSMVGNLWDLVVQSPWSPELAALACHLCWLSGCMWVLIALGLSVIWPSLQLVNWGSLCPLCLVFCCAGADRLCWSWFLCLSKVSRLLSRYCSVVCSGWFLHHLVVLPDWSWLEVSVASIHSFTTFLYYLLVVPLLVGSLFQQVYWYSKLPPTFLCDQLEGGDKMD